jgi:hypothetical protein
MISVVVYASCTLALSIAAWSACTWAVRLATLAVRWSSSCRVASPCFDRVVRSRQVLLGVGEAGLVLRQLGCDVIEAGLKRRRVDLRQQVALLDDLAFLESHPLDLAVHARPHGDGVGRLHCAEPIQGQRKRPLFHAPDVHGRLGRRRDTHGRFRRGQLMPAGVSHREAGDCHQRPVPCPKRGKPVLCDAAHVRSVRGAMGRRSAR